MQDQKACFNALGFTNTIANSLYPILGPSAFSNNYTSILQILVDYSLSTDTAFQRDRIYDEFLSYGGTEEIADVVIATLLTALHRMFKPIYQERLGSHVFSATLYSDGRLIVEDHGGLPEPHYGTEPDLFKAFQRDLIEGLANGDWVSPRLRRYAGV